MKIQKKTLTSGFASLTVGALLALMGATPVAFAQTTGSTTDTTGSTTSMTSTSTEPMFCTTATSSEGYFVTTDFANYPQGQSINFCLADNTRNPLFLDGTHPWEITDQSGNIIFMPDAGTLNTNASGTNFFADNWNGMNASSTNVPEGMYNVVFPGFPGAPFATFSIMNSASTSSSTTSTSTESTGSTGSTTSSSTNPVDVTDLWNQLRNLEAQVSALLQEIQSALGNAGGGNGTQEGASIDQNGQTFLTGSSVDFSGRNFNHEENVTIALNGSMIGSAHADGGGNFSTGSMSLPSTPGSYTYTFTGSSGDSAQATITVH